ncbi:MAG: glycoside hydrolase family 44 protein [Bdellovibrio sp.]
MKKSLLLVILITCQSVFNTAIASGITEHLEAYNFVETKDVDGKIVVDLNTHGQTIDKTFYGSQMDSATQPPLSNLVLELGVGQIRIGGNEYDTFNWKNNVTITKSGTHKLLSFFDTETILRSYKVTGIYQINLLGYQPELQEKTYSLKNTFSEKSAYDLVKTLNGQLKLNIENFSLGNEPEQWHETHSYINVWTLDSGISADEYIDKYIKFAIAVRKAQEEVNGNPNSIKIWGPEISSSWLDWNTGNFIKDCNWSDTVRSQVNCSYGYGRFDHFIPYFLNRLATAEKDLKINPRKYKLLDYFAFHYYPNFRTKISDINSVVTDGTGLQSVSKMLESTRVLNDPTYTNTVDLSSYRNFSPNIIGRMKNWLSTYYADAKLAINEFSVDSDYRSNVYHPIVRPLYTAEAMAIAATEGVSFFNNFILNDSPSSPTPWTMISGTKKTNNFYSFSILSKYFVGTILKVHDNFGDTVNSYATESNDFINLLIINKSPADKKISIYVKNGNEKKMATYKVSGWSISILKIAKNPETATKTYEVRTFGADEMGIEKDLRYAK